MRSSVWFINYFVLKHTVIRRARQLALNFKDFTLITREVEVTHGYGKKKYIDVSLTENS